VSLFVDIGPVEAQDIDEQTLGEPVAANHGFGVRKTDSVSSTSRRGVTATNPSRAIRCKVAVTVGGATSIASARRAAMTGRPSLDIV
jgi:hypothetical protein